MLLIFSGLMSQSSLLIYLWIKGVQTRKVAVVINLCTSRNNVMSNIVADYEGRTAEMMQEGNPSSPVLKPEMYIDSDFFLGAKVMTMAMMSMMLMNAIELVCYLVICVDLYKQTNSLIGIISQKSIQRRTRGSALSFSGQAFSFILEIFITYLCTKAVQVLCINP